MKVLDKIKKVLGQDGSRVKVPTILQMEAVECGAASLAMILAHYGKWLPLEKVRQECGVNRDGSNAKNILRAARKLGMEGKGRFVPADELKEQGFPLIIHWEFNHFVVLEGIKNEIAYLNDPALGRRTVPFKEFSSSYTGITLVLKPGQNFQREGKPYNIVKAVANKLLEDKSALVLVSIISLFSIIPGLATPVFSQIFLDEILTLNHLDWILNLCLAMICGICVTAALNTLRAVILTRWQKKLTLADSASLFRHMLRLPVQFFQQRYASEVASRIEFNESIASVLSDSAATAMLDFIVAIFFLLLLLQYSVELTIISVFFSSVSICVFFFVRRKLTDLNMRVQQDTGKEYGTLINSLAMIESVKATGTESDVFSKWAGYRAKVVAGTQETQFYSLLISELPTFLGGLNAALILTIGGFSIMDGTMTTGIYTAFQNLIGSFQQPISKLVSLGATLQTTEMQMRRIDDVRAYPIDDLNFSTEDENNSAREIKRLSGDLELKNVSFGYSPLDPPLLENFNMHLKAGNRVAIVGYSGSGKSTLAKIITGLYEEWSGDILFDGKKRRELPRATLVNSISTVDQDVFHLNGTVQENITMFDTSIKKADVIQAAKDACIHEDILQLEGGYDGMVSEGGTNFSGGQRQRLEIARALVRNPSILVLDEATSALDTVTEKKLLDNIRRRGCSCILIAHRLSTIRDSDEIIMLERGKIVQRGTHFEMMETDGPYLRLIAESQEGA